MLFFHPVIVWQKMLSKFQMKNPVKNSPTPAVNKVFAPEAVDRGIVGAIGEYLMMYVTRTVQRTSKVPKTIWWYTGLR